MSKYAPCTVAGCDRNAHHTAQGARGWCRAHYARWRKHGSPTGGSTSPMAARRFFNEIVLHTDDDECVIWPFHRGADGYGRIQHEGKSNQTSRLVCIAAHGEPPTPRHEAAHICGRGSDGCVNPRHLEWKTPAENQADKVRHGTAPRGERSARAKLTRSDVQQIRSLHGRLSMTQLARRFGVGQPNIHAIVSRRTWAWLPEERL